MTESDAWAINEAFRVPSHEFTDCQAACDAEGTNDWECPGHGRVLLFMVRRHAYLVHHWSVRNAAARIAKATGYQIELVPHGLWGSFLLDRATEWLPPWAKHSELYPRDDNAAPQWAWEGPRSAYVLAREAVRALRPLLHATGCTRCGRPWRKWSPLWQGKRLHRSFPQGTRWDRWIVDHSLGHPDWPEGRCCSRACFRRWGLEVAVPEMLETQALAIARRYLLEARRWLRNRKQEEAARW